MKADRIVSDCVRFSNRIAEQHRTVILNNQNFRTLALYSLPTWKYALFKLTVDECLTKLTDHKVLHCDALFSDHLMLLAQVRALRNVACRHYLICLTERLTVAG